MDNNDSINDSLVELEETYNYDSEIITKELILWASLLCRGEGEFWSSSNATDVRNERGARLVSFFGENTAASIRDQIGVGYISIDVRLPDVCGSCFTSYGLTVGGRYRSHCPSCQGQEARRSWDRLLEMHRICWNSSVNEAVLCQIIHKYYAPNGDPTWVMKTISPLI